MAGSSIVVVVVYPVCALASSQISSSVTPVRGSTLK